MRPDRPDIFNRELDGVFMINTIPDVPKPAPGETGLRATIYGYYHPGKGGLFTNPPISPKRPVVLTGAAGMEFLKKEGFL